VEDLIPLPTDFTGEGELFMLRVRGDSMIEAGILDGDFVVARQQQVAENGDIVVAGIPGDEATIKTFKKSGKTITLIPANETMKPMVFDADEVQVFGKLVTVMRKL
jgi:repressor LexA